MRWSAPLLALLLWGAFLSLSAAAFAHQFAPALLDLKETAPGRLAVLWKQPAVRVMGSVLRPVLPGACKGIGVPVAAREGTGIVARWQIACPAGLVGQSLEVEGLASSRADALLRVELLDGRSFVQILTADEPSFLVPEEKGQLAVLQSYIELGIEHILTGWDHLIFVLALVLLVGWGAKLLWTITAFTLGHSVTLALAVLGVVNVPPAPIEAVIALSVFYLAVELSRRRADKPTLVQRYPWRLAAAFGLLHGRGLAGALTEIGLPPGDIPLALFAFNVGIEIGQIAFVAAVLIVGAVLRAAWSALPWRGPGWAAHLPATVIGGLAVYWVCERATGIWLTPI